MEEDSQEDGDDEDEGARDAREEHRVEREHQHAEDDPRPPAHVDGLEEVFQAFSVIHVWQWLGASRRTSSAS